MRRKDDTRDTGDTPRKCSQGTNLRAIQVYDIGALSLKERNEREKNAYVAPKADITLKVGEGDRANTRLGELCRECPLATEGDCYLPVTRWEVGR